MTRLTVSGLLRTVRHAEETIEILSCPGGSKRVLMEVGTLRQFLQDVIGSSHMGCAENEVILELGDN